MDGQTVTVKGPKGELTAKVAPTISVSVDDGVVTVTRPDDVPDNRAKHGLTRSLIGNMVHGVSEGFSRTLEIVGVGFKAEMKGKNLQLALGFSHPIFFFPPDEIEISVPEPTKVTITGADKQLVGQVAAKIRKLRPPEPYKGKGVKYEGEYIRRKAGKAAA
jgi:large subunit ribosomal protein L6